MTTMDNRKLKSREILYDDSQLGPYPDHLLKRVDEPTSKIIGEVMQRDPRKHALSNNMSGVYGPKAQERAPQMTIEYPVGKALSRVLQHINSIREKRNAPSPYKAPIPDDPRVLSRHVKSLGYFLGADLVGICEMPKSAYYTNDLFTGEEIDTHYKYAIVLLCGKNTRTTNASNGYDWIFDSCSFQAYQRLAVQTEDMAYYLRTLGFDSEASNMWNYLTLMPELVLRAGLGEISRLGIVLNPFLGANFKAAAVLTDMPLEPDKYIDFGLQEFCGSCDICATQCPSGAIPSGDKVIYNGYETWKIDEKKCAVFDVMNAQGNVCGRCAKVCPWSRKDNSPNVFKDWDGSIESLHKDAKRRAAELKAKGFVEEEELTRKWWFDLVEESGDTDKYDIPKTSIKKGIY